MVIYRVNLQAKYAGIHLGFVYKTANCEKSSKKKKKEKNTEVEKKKGEKGKRSFGAGCT